MVVVQVPGAAFQLEVQVSSFKFKLVVFWKIKSSAASSARNYHYGRPALKTQFPTDSENYFYDRDAQP
jgi:hypothetical protein